MKQHETQQDLEKDSDEEIGFFDDEFDELDEIPDRYAVPEVEELIDEVMETLAGSRPLPMSTMVKINRDEILHLLEQVQDRLPEELRAARWLLKERDDFVAKAKQEHADLIEEGRNQVARMVEKEQVVKAAEVRARQIISDARHEAHTMKRQVEEFCDGRLASMETIMSKTMLTLQKGRKKLLEANSNQNSESFQSNSYIDLDRVEESA